VLGNPEMGIAEGGDLREVRDYQHLVSVSERPQFFAHHLA